ncbi:uncharacterized protein LOC128557868 [Mercenaria mercenaria]|uniref:uncharacterized protein LOC128557868 n=1 Tax=Mercenaria mercenaria TaxID=6596 RepID=UPI00234ECD90|nr:uncharacterized protein LOC128557868 [Mercenaria mercenaria]
MAKVVHLFLLSVIFAILAVTTNYRGMYKMDHMSECSRFCAVVIWDINTDDTDIRFIYHKRFLYALISKMPEGSYIILKTTDDLNTELIFKKDFRWTEQLHGIKFSFSNNKAAIPHSLLQKTVETSLDWNETADMDIQLFLLLNDISHFDDEKKAGEALTIVNTFVVFTGKIQPQSVFTDLASDEQHVYGPITGDTNDNIFRY